MKRTIAFLMMLLYLSFVTGQVWSCCEENKVSLRTVKQTIFFKGDDTANAGSHNLSTEDCATKSSKHPSATKIKFSRFNADGIAFKILDFDGFTDNHYQPVSSANSILHPTRLFIRNRVLRI